MWKMGAVQIIIIIIIISIAVVTRERSTLLCAVCLYSGTLF